MRVCVCVSVGVFDLHPATRQVSLVAKMRMSLDQRGSHSFAELKKLGERLCNACTLAFTLAARWQIAHLVNCFPEVCFTSRVCMLRS